MFSHRRENGWSRGTSSLGAKSSRPMGLAKLSLSPDSSRAQVATLLIFRVIGVMIIIVSTLWFYLLCRIMRDFGSAHDQSMTDIARPPVFKSHDVLRLEWLIKMRLEKPAPMLDVSKMDSPILVFTHERAEYLERALWKLFQHHPAHQAKYTGNLRENSEDIGRIMGSPVVISQDGNNSAVREVIEAYRNLFERKLGVPLYRIEHLQQTVPVNAYSSWEDWQLPYKKLAVHYGWGLEQVFSGSAYTSNKRQHARKIPDPPLPTRVVILEEDIEISRDFFSLMNATAGILDKDDTLLAVSAYNDNGNENHVLDHKRLVRSDFFPGLGWMINRETWEGPAKHQDAGLKGKWPDGFWDDWIRECNIRRGRQVLRPEISRSFHFGNVKGASASDAALKLSKIQLDEINVRWEEEDLSYLDSVTFAQRYWDRVAQAVIVQTDVDAKKLVAHKDVRVQYSDWKQFKLLATTFGIMQDEKAGVPRTAYEGIVEIRYGGGNFFIYLTPPYVNNLIKPPDFGTKAWADFSKETLLQKLGISDKTDDFIFR